jgi:hypothetical protein
MNVGYSFWGFLGDKKFDQNGNEISTPDGNAFYSWSIIKAFQDRGDQVFTLMPDRDKYGYNILKSDLFNSWCKKERLDAYNNIKNVHHFGMLDFILLEWRWEIKGRNELVLEGNENWQPDLKRQCDILEEARLLKIPVIVFDLDYKLTIEDIKKYNIKYVIELGNKWESCTKAKSKTVYIPFDFNCINEFKINNNPENNLVYIGNRYERDWCIDKYIPEDLDKCIIHGNWLESNRDSKERWKNLNFAKRLQTSEMHDAYSSSIATILLAKKEYCIFRFMTARIIEAIFYGTVPLFIEEYGNNMIESYAGEWCDFLKVSSKQEVKERINELKCHTNVRKEIIQYFRKHLRFMDCKFFVQDVIDLLEE